MMIERFTFKTPGGTAGTDEVFVVAASETEALLELRECLAESRAADRSWPLVARSPAENFECEKYRSAGPFSVYDPGLLEPASN